MDLASPAVSGTSVYASGLKQEEMPEQWKQLIIVPVYKKGNKTDCWNYRGMSLLSATYRILSSILLARLTPYAKEITGYNKHGFRCNRSTTDQVFCFCHIFEKKMGIQ